LINKDNNKLFLSEYDYHVEDFLKRGASENDTWVALGPSSMHKLEMKGIKYLIPEQFCGLEDIEKACVNQFEKVSEVCKKLDLSMLDLHPFLLKWDIKPFFYNLWMLGHVVDAVLSRYLWLKSILSNFPDHTVYIHKGPTSPWETDQFFFGHRETIWGNLLALAGWKNEIILLPEDSFSRDQSYSDISFTRSWLKNYVEYHFSVIRNNSMIKTIVFSFMNRIWKNIIRTLCEKYRMDNTYIVSSLYDWQPMLDLFMEDGKSIFFLSDMKDILKKRKSVRDIQDNIIWEEFVGSFPSDEIDYVSLIKDRVLWIVNEAPLLAEKIINELERNFGSNGYTVVLSALIPYYSELVMRKYFLQKGNTVLVYQHGSVWFDRRISQRIDIGGMTNASMLLTYGEAVTDAFLKSDINRQCLVKSVGSTRLDKLKNVNGKVSSSEHVKYRILYVITSYYYSRWYCGFSPPFSDRFYYREQMILIKNLIKMVESIGNISLTIKLHPNFEEDPPWINDFKRSDNVRLIRDTSFVELMSDHNIIVIDSPTTTLLQAISTRLPVYALTSIVKPSQNDLHILKKRAVCCDSAESMIEVLKKHIEDGSYRANVDDNEYEKLYCTYLDDGKSERRVYSLVKDLISAN